MRSELARAWSIDADDLVYIPKGVGSYHWQVHSGDGSYFVTVDDLDRKPWIGRDRDSTFAGLAAAYETALLLFDEGLDLVVAPLRADDGACAVRLDDQYSIAVFPFVEGRAWDWGESISQDERTRLLRGLGELHATRPVAATRIAVHSRELPERDVLMDALANLERPWRGSAYAEVARAALAQHEPRVRERLARFDALAAELDEAGATRVVTHGEPHPGNLIHAPTGLRLIDWDTVALAEPERDLWMLDDRPGVLDQYVASTGRVIDRAAIEYYRLAWTLSDIASFTDLFRRDQERTQWAERKWSGFVALLHGAPSVPYAP
jgi:spectinomycin phosphotransferase